MDISTHDKTAVEIFRIIIERGPITLYTTNVVSKMPIGTIHRHFKEMLSTEKIKPYKISSKGRKKIEYGPTLYGFIYFYKVDEEIKNNLDSYFDKWIEKSQFVLELRQAGFDEKSLESNPKLSKKIFERFVYFYAGVEEQLDYFAKNISEVSRDIRWFLGAFLLVRKKEYMRVYEEIVNSLPGYRSDVSEFLEEIIKSHSRLKKMNK